MTATAALALAAARMAPLGWVAPPLGGPARAARVVVAALMTATVMPLVQAAPAPRSLPAAIFAEALVGLLLALVAALPLRAAEGAGAILDGTAQPWRRSGPLADGYALFALALFAAFDGPRLLIVAAGQSYTALPLGHGLAGVTLPQLLAVGGRLIVAAVTLAAPALAALLVADLALALVARPQPLLAAAVAAAPLRLVIVVLTVAAGALAGAHALSRMLADAAALKLTP